MAEYELVREIQNSCSGNQMRDVFFDEIETDDPIAWVKAQTNISEVTCDTLRDGLLVVAGQNGYIKRFTFVEI